MSEPALHIPFRFVSKTDGVVIDNGSLRRPDLALRCTKYGTLVDERVLSKPFEIVTRPNRLCASLVLEGRVFVETPEGVLVAGPGEGVVHPTELLDRTRYEASRTLELDWEATTTRCGMLRSFDIESASSIGRELFAPRSQRDLFSRAFAFFRDVGAPIDPALDALEGSPTERDHRIGRAVAEQLAHLGSRATAFHLSDATDLSPRQLQRILGDFIERYGLNARSWRDLRNRWRVKVAIVLLAYPDMSLETIAKEVGYGSASALVRAMAAFGLPGPTKLRGRLLERQP